MLTALINAILIDGRSPEPREGATVVLEDKRIVDVTSGPPPGSARVIDLRGRWLLPGLFDVHVHLTPWGMPNHPVPRRTTMYGANAAAGILKGVTTIRVAGVEHWIDVHWRDAFARGDFLGPRIVASGYFLTTTAGHGVLNEALVQEHDGPFGWVKAVREQIKNGADQIKIDMTGGIIGPPWDHYTRTYPMEEELEPAFRLANTRGFKVLAHATHAEAVKQAIRLGVHSIEHGYVLDDECLALMKERGVFYVPTLAVSHMTPKQATNDWERKWIERYRRPQEQYDRADAAQPIHTQSFQRALKAGVPMALGSDLRQINEGGFLEMGMWARDGATPMQVIQAATRVAAQACCLENEVGTVEPGKLADLLVVEESPLQDINNLRKTSMVLKEGLEVLPPPPAMGR